MENETIFAGLILIFIGIIGHKKIKTKWIEIGELTKLQRGIIFFLGIFVFIVGIGPSFLFFISLFNLGQSTSTPTPTTTIATTPTTPTLAPTTPATFTNPTSMEFVLISAGEFDMGSPASEVGRYDSEGPINHVKLSKAFYLGKYEVTQKQWRDVMGNNPSYFRGDDRPVEQVSWDDVQQFIKKLNEKESTNKYRLPSEAEWEYAVRSGTTTRYSYGDDESILGDYAWYYNNANDMTHRVGLKKSNLWGLHDMHGNVGEWVQDIYHNNYSGAPIDGSAWEGGSSTRTIRGGSRVYGAERCRSASRSYDAPGNLHNDLGFRLLKEL